MQRVPIALDAGMRKFFCGPESFTPDLQPIVGEAPELRNYFVAAGLNSIGILTGGGLGRVLAHWIINGRPGRRRHRHSTSTGCTATRPTRSTAARARSSRSAWSTSATTRTASMQTARGAKRSPLHDRLAARGRVLPRRQRLGGRRLVRAARASSPNVGPLIVGPATNWFPYWEAEHRGLPRGRDPDGHVVHVEVPRPGPRRRAACSTTSRPTTSTATAGAITYTQWLNEARQARGRPHGDQARRRALLGRRLRHRAPPRRDVDARDTSATRTRSSPT